MTWRRHSSFLLVTFSSCVLATAQDVSSKITGTVHDPSGAAIPGATVTAHETSRGIDYNAKTNADGVYFLSPLPIGSYTLRIQAPGFGTVQRNAFDLVQDQTARVDISLNIGQTSSVVEVNDVAPLLQTDQSFLGTVLDAHATSTLPLATRNYNQLTLLTPGAVSTNLTSFQGAQASFQVGRPYINGNREQTNNYILDGMDNNQIDNDDVAFSPNVDAIQNFDLISQNPPASYGNFIGGVISVTLKSGSNKFHGDVLEFLRNDVFNANSWAAGLTKGQAPSAGTYADGSLRKAPLRWNEFGGTIGGPILKDKLFFFGDYQGSRFDRPATVNTYTVIPTAERTGNFASVCTAGFNTAGICANPAQQLYNPFSANTPAGRQPFAFNNISGSLSPAATKIVNSNLYPAATNLTASNGTNTVRSPTNADQGDVKIDWVASPKDHIYGRYAQQHIVNPQTNSQELLGNGSSQFPLYNGVLDYARTISSSFLNDFRLGASYFPVTELVINNTGQNLTSVFGIAGETPGQTFLPALNFSGSNLGTSTIGTNNLVSSFHDTVAQIEDTVTLIRGNHNIDVGFEYYNYRANVLYVGNDGLAGDFTFNGSFTSNAAAGSPLGIAEADFLLGLPENVGLGVGGGKSIRNALYAGFVQDNWHASPNLTLNLGLRYEVQTPRGETHDQSTNYNLQTGAVEIAGINGSQALYNQYNGPTNFQPRLGFAYSLGGSHNTVLRGAYGISNFLETTGTGNLLFQNPPFVVPHNVTYAGGTMALPGSTLDQGFSGFPSSGCTVPGALALSAACFSEATIHAFDPNGFRPSVSQQYNLAIQHQLTNSSTFQIAYVGQKTDHLASIALINQKVLNPDGTISPSPYLNPTLQALVGQARLTSSTGYSNYNALQFSFQQRLYQGLEFQANYTYSKCLGNTSGFFAQYGDAAAGSTQAGNNHFFFQNTYDPAADYGRCDQNLTNVFNGYVTYALPVGRGKLIGAHMSHVADLAVGGWQANTVLQFHGGFPITPQASDNSGTTSGFPRADCNGAPIITGTLRSPAPNPGYEWFSASDVSQPLSGFGNCGVGSYTGPGMASVDASLFKDFSITESQRFEFRAEAINVLNHPILNAPVSSIGSRFGLVNTAQGERNLQFAVKYLF